MQAKYIYIKQFYSTSVPLNSGNCKLSNCHQQLAREMGNLNLCGELHLACRATAETC